MSFLVGWIDPSFIRLQLTVVVVPEFDVRVVGDGRSATTRYANNSNYRNDSLIRKESASIPAMVAGRALQADRFGQQCV